MFDDDFSSETGRYADLNNDGKVDSAEYLNDCDDFDRIYKKGNHPYGKYTPPQQSSNEPPKIYCAWGIIGWILALIGCFAPTINTLIYTDGDEIGFFGVILTIILLIAWIWGFSNRAK